MAAAGLAVWLPHRALVPGVLLIWALPILAREMLDDGRSVGWTETAVLGGLVVLAISLHWGYAATLNLFSSQSRSAAGSLESRPEVFQSLEPVIMAEDDLPQMDALRRSPALPRRRLLANAPTLSAADASDFLLRLKVLDTEVMHTGSSLRQR
jgi:hypothetical protein